MSDCIQGRDFAQYLVTQLPVYDSLIIRDIRPTDGWVGHVSTGTWEAFTSTSHTYDRFRNVMPNVTKTWQRMPEGSCIGTPCDPPTYQIGWGWERNTYYRERQSWDTQLLCFDQILTVTQAKEHFSQIVSDILRPATNYIMSHFMRKRSADYAGKKWLASSTMQDFTFTWDVVGDDEIYIDTSGDPTSKLTPQMLQRRVFPLQLNGYFGKQPFQDMPPLIELVTDYETCWDLDKAATDTNVNDRWRFQEWDYPNRYYRYNFGGQIGNYVVRVDPFALRFNKISNGRYQLVLPYVNTPTTEGIGSEPNPSYQDAQYQFSYIMHRQAIMFLVAQTETVNPLMPFANRSLAGQWQFVMDNLGADCNGRPIANERRNKGKFLADFDVAAKPVYVEWMELIFHKREQAVVYAVDTCTPDPGYPTQYYNSSNAQCNNDQLFNPVPNEDGDYQIAAATVTCDGVPIANQLIEEESITDLVNALNSDPGTSSLGIWILNDSGSISITETDCENIVIPWVTT